MPNPMDFPLVTNNTDLIQVNVNKLSDRSPANLPGSLIIVQVFFPNSNNVAFTKRGSDIIIIAGAFQFPVNPSDSVNLNGGDYRYEPVIVMPSGAVHTVTNGDFDLTPGIIRFRKQLTVQS